MVATTVALRRMLSWVPTPITLRRLHVLWFRFRRAQVWVWAPWWLLKDFARGTVPWSTFPREMRKNCWTHHSIPWCTLLLRSHGYNGYHNIWRGNGTTAHHGRDVSSVLVRDPPPFPPPLPALRANLVVKGKQLLAIHMVAPEAPEKKNFIPLAHFVHFAPQH